jgi:hypothetical protein
VAENSVAQNAQHPPLSPEERWAAIKQRTTRGMLVFNAGGVAHLEGDCWAVQSTRGGFHRVDLVAESCTCEDYAYFGSERGITCKHVYAAAIAHATRRTHRARRVDVIAADLSSEPCERCGAVADLVTLDRVPLCEGCTR